ncbi:dynein intermediate chain 3, ciliary [Caerostris extrusa]|uniref:Dynein intermediate chain 3, ciliary n=1 Tax=Caerostris extrusa TaxID=172846 RepID=A0AAV4PEC3_CAEEX|nr:dynein intermediate chain 3, ciliary [Caerostris extrusa]
MKHHFEPLMFLLDPNSVVRKVVDICWAENSSKLAAAYSVDGIENPERDLCLILTSQSKDLPNLEDLYTISCAEYDPSVPEVFMVGTEQGQVLKFSRQAQSDFDKITARYDCENRPILCLKRNAFYPQLFASCDPWTIKIWSEVMDESQY